MTSGNRSDEPIAVPTTARRRERLGGIADAFLTHDRPIHRRCEDSVVPAPRVSRSAARAATSPRPLRLPVAGAPADPGRRRRAEEHLLPRARRRRRSSRRTSATSTRSRLPSLRSATRALHRHARRATPEVIAHDLHPDYLLDPLGDDAGPRGWRCSTTTRTSPAAWPSTGCDEPAIGVVFDGTGYGTDGTIWGGELLRCDLAAFERVAHLEPVALPGGERAMREPWRMAAALPRARAGGRCPFASGGIAVRAGARRVNAPLSSGVGRLFDAVAALLGVCEGVSYEGQAAIELEQLAGGTPQRRIRAGSRTASCAAQTLSQPPSTISTRAAPRAEIAAAFHEGLRRGDAAAASLAAGPRTVVLSGGSFQNLRLLASTRRRLELATGSGSSRTGGCRRTTGASPRDRSRSRR